MRSDATREQSGTFADQFGDFLRRNLSWFLAVGLTLLVLQDVFGMHGVLAMRRSQREEQEVRRQIDQINEENRQLEERVKALKSDPQAIEKIAREEMGLARPGEYIFKIPEKPADASNSSAPATPATPEKQP